MTTSHQTWLRRLSDYHSGGVSEPERLAVEAHLMDCAECQEALTMYRRLYTLLRSPLRVDTPSLQFDETNAPRFAGPQPAPTEPPALRPDTSPPRNRRALAGVAAILAAAVIIAGFLAVVAPRLRSPGVGSGPSPRASLTAQAHTPLGSFVCANPAGSSMVYAYVRGDGGLYTVTGCGAPRKLASGNVYPIAWSPNNRYLAVLVVGGGPPDMLEIIDAQTSAIRPIKYPADFGVVPQVGSQARIFLGWIDDSTFLGGLVTITSNPSKGFHQAGPTTLERVSVQTGASVAIGRISGWANVSQTYYNQTATRIVANGRYFFYAGYNAAGTTAYLHRFDLTTGKDTQLVSLGDYLAAACQSNDVICGWTAPWDVSADGAHILYHNTGTASAPIDSNYPQGSQDTPIYYANPDGSGASKPFGDQLASSLVAPIFSPNGALALTTGSSYDNSQQDMKVVRFGGSATVVAGAAVAWRGDSAAIVVVTRNGAQLYTIATGAATPLEAGTTEYLWGNSGS